MDTEINFKNNYLNVFDWGDTIQKAHIINLKLWNNKSSRFTRSCIIKNIFFKKTLKKLNK